jgi:small subunit ribosomal protein S20
MANSAQARKRARQAAKANSHNSALRSKMRTSIKTLDIIADKKIIHKNKAARHKSRLAAAIKNLSAAAAQ